MRPARAIASTALSWRAWRPVIRFSTLRYANAAAALTTTGYTAIAPIPRPAAVRELLARAR
jgi:hypothetical protein